MIRFVVAALVTIVMSGTSFAQTPSAAPNAVPAHLSVAATPVSEIIKNPRAKAILEQLLPDIAQYYSQIGDMTLTQVAPMSDGQIDDDKLKAVQAEFDKLN